SSIFMIITSGPSKKVALGARRRTSDEIHLVVTRANEEIAEGDEGRLVLGALVPEEVDYDGKLGQWNRHRAQSELRAQDVDQAGRQRRHGGGGGDDRGGRRERRNHDGDIAGDTSLGVGPRERAASPARSNVDFDVPERRKHFLRDPPFG